MPADTVTVDRKKLMALLVEVEAVADVLERAAGKGPTPLTEDLLRKVGPVAEAVLGPENFEGLWDKGERRARVLLGSLQPQGPRPVLDLGRAGGDDA